MFTFCLHLWLHFFFSFSCLWGESRQAVWSLWDLFCWFMGLESPSRLAASALRALERGSHHAEGGCKCFQGATQSLKFPLAHPLMYESVDANWRRIHKSSTDTCFEINDCFCEGHELVLVKILWWIDIFDIRKVHVYGWRWIGKSTFSEFDWNSIRLLDYWIEGLGKKKHSTIFDLYLKVPVFLMFITDLYLYLYTMNILSLSTTMLRNSITSVGCKELISIYYVFKACHPF